jgi:nitrogen regulatory protein P-II 1
MKLIRSIIRPDKLDELKEALGSVDVVAFTVTEVRDHSPYNLHPFCFRGYEYERDDLMRIDLTLIVHDAEVDNVVAMIVKTARTKDVGDGFISVMPVEHRYNIHTGQRELP